MNITLIKLKYYIDLKDLMKKSIVYDNAIKINSEVSEIYRRKGNILKELGRNTEAFNSYEMALSLAPKQPSIYTNMGILLRDQGKKLEAKEYFKKSNVLRSENI